MKLVVALAASSLFMAAPDALRAGGSSAPVLEIVTFRLVDGSDPAAFVGAAKGTEAALRARGALVRRFLTVDSTGVWTDVIEWTDMDAALAAAEAVMAMPDFAPFGTMIDGDSVVMRHAPILWRME